MTKTTQIIILRSIDYQESSKIITVLSKEHGKISLIARGARRLKSKLAGLIEVGNILDVVYYYKETRSLHTLSEASVAYQSLSFRQDFEKASVLYSTLELITQLTHENQKNTDIFNFADSFIRWLGNLDNVNLLIFPYVQIRMAQLIGIGLFYEPIPENSYAFLNISSGTVSNSPDTELSIKLTQKQSEFVVKALNSRSNSILTARLEGYELKQLIHHFDIYFKYHIEGFKERRSDSIFEQIL